MEKVFFRHSANASKQGIILETTCRAGAVSAAIREDDSIEICFAEDRIGGDFAFLVQDGTRLV
jgi:hypothetical protein